MRENLKEEKNDRCCCRWNGGPTSEVVRWL